MLIKCSYCHTMHVANTVFCDECGNYLLEDEIRETDLDMKARLQATPADRAGFSPVYQESLKPVAIRLTIGPQKRQVEVPLNRVIHLGRISPAANIFPEVDLSDNVHAERTVSRRHARILKQGNKVLVEDLDSINGTFINGKKLDPYLPEPLNDGDLLQLGRLRIEVEIISSPRDKGH